MKKLFNGFCLFIALFIIAVKNNLGANNDISLLHISSPPVSSNGHIDSISWYETPTDNIYSDKYEATFINLSKLKPVNTNIWTEEGEYDIISLTQDNQQLLHLFMDGYSVMEGHLDMLPEYQDKLKSVRTKDCFDKNSTNYNLLTDDDITLLYSGNRTIDVSKVLYINYHESSVEPKQSWIELFQSKLNELGYDSPVIISESYSFEIDGHYCELVTANNSVNHEYKQICSSDENWEDVAFDYLIPTTENNAVYRFNAFFIDNQLIYCTQHKREITIDENQYRFMATPVISYHLFDTYQYVNGEVKLCPVYGSSYFDYAFRGAEQVIAADVDGDNIIEIVFYNNDGWAPSKELLAGQIDYDDGEFTLHFEIRHPL